MNEKKLRAALQDLPLSEIRYYPSIPSTNDEALAWATEGAADFSLVIADEQTAGRGRAGRKWYTPPGAALAFSLILRPSPAEQAHLSRMVGLAAVSLAFSLERSGLQPRIKWPNDVLLLQRKVAGILVETVWSGTQADCVVIGIGLNVLHTSIPPAEELQFPAISLEEVLGSPPAREILLHDILLQLVEWRPRLGDNELIAAWAERLAYRGETVFIWQGEANPRQGILLGLEPDGSLRLRDEQEIEWIAHFGDVHLRPAS
jgi:BirA family biotin operon repressor/biotin-[acetyl-CoA-carboxylase] ligase